MTQDDYEYISDIVTRAFNNNGFVYQDNSLELQDLIQEGILYIINNNKYNNILINNKGLSLKDNPDNKLIIIRIISAIRDYLRDHAGLVQTQRYKEPMALVYPDDPEMWEEVRESSGYTEEFYDDAELNELLVKKCNSFLRYPANNMVLFRYGVIGKKLDGYTYADLGQMFGVSKQRVHALISKGLKRLSADKDLQQAYELLTGRNIWTT